MESADNARPNGECFVLLYPMVTEAVSSKNSFIVRPQEIATLISLWLEGDSKRAR